MGPARHEIVASTFRRCPGQNRGLDFPVVSLLEKRADRARGPRAQPQTLLHLRPAQIHVPVAQPHILAGVGIFIQLKRRCCRGIENLQRSAQYFHLAGGHVRIDRSFGPRAHPASHLQHKFVANPIRCRKTFFRVGIVNNLDNAGSIANVEENYATVIPPAMNPTIQLHLLADAGRVEFTTIMTAH